MFKNTLLIFTVFFIAGLSILVYSVWQYNLPLITPFSLIENYIAPFKSNNKIVYGFFPYWNLKYSDKLHIKDITHFAYFSLSLNSDGTIQKKINSQELEPGWNKLRSSDLDKIIYQSRLLGQKIILTITAMEPEIISEILNSPINQETAISSIIQIVVDKNFDGVNIDFESVSSPDQTTRDNFTQFIKSLKLKCQNIKPNCEVDIDIFADSARRNRLYDLASLSQIADHIVVMTYDYYRKSSTQAGPVAPLRGACPKTINFSDFSSLPASCLEQDITTNISEITSIVPSQKLILGIPFYGYEWQTSTKDFMANTYSRSGSMASYQRIIELLSGSDTNASSISALWSTATLSPYLTYETNGEIHQIHYESPQSLDLKVKLVNSANLGGLAIWALGYEVPYLDIWQPISDYLLAQ